MLCADAGQAQGDTAAAAQEQAQVLVSSFIKQHFDKLPPDQVKASRQPLVMEFKVTGHGAQVFGAIREIFQVFDTNGDKALDAAELRQAFACMVMRELYRSCVVMTSVACACDSMLK